MSVGGGMEPKKFPVLFCFLQMLQKNLFKKKKKILEDFGLSFSEQVLLLQ
jgi:hypothetical protein